jgi:hypothetical protein
MAINQTPEAPKPAGENQIFASQFLEKGPELKVPDGRYDSEQQVYIRDLDGKPAFVDEFLCTSKGNEITTHHTTNVSGATFSDPDNG